MLLCIPIIICVLRNLIVGLPLFQVGWGITVPLFNYLGLQLPQRITTKKLQLLLLRIDIEKELTYQKQRQVELETELLTTRVIYKGTSTIAKSVS